VQPSEFKTSPFVVIDYGLKSAHKTDIWSYSIGTVSETFHSTGLNRFREQNTTMLFDPHFTRQTMQINIFPLRCCPRIYMWRHMGKFCSWRNN